MKTKVAIVLPYFGSGGAENMVSRLASNLNLNEVDAEVIAVYGNPQNNRLEREVIEHGVPIRYMHKGLGFSFKAMLNVYKELNRFSPDVVHTHLSGCIYSSLWILTHTKKMLHTIHNMPLHEFGKAKRTVMSILYVTGKAIPVAISDEILHLIGNTYKTKYDAELIYNPVDIKRFSQVKKVPHEEFVIVNVGRLEPQKNHKMLVDAFECAHRRIPNMRLKILGDGPLRSDLQNYINLKELNQWITLDGRVENVEDYLAGADLFALSSDYEGLPLSILEAMAAGLPIVTTNVGGVSDIVTDNGKLVEKGNVDAFAAAIQQLVVNRELRDIYAENSAKNVLKYDSTIIASEYMELYKKYGRN